MRRLVLASTSPFRKELLQRLGVAFETAAPNVDEAPLLGEAPEALVVRLAEAKAAAVAARFPDALVIGSDQVSVREGEILGKPGTRERAVAQLLAAAGKEVRFLTGLCVLNSATGERQMDVVPYAVRFRRLPRERIERYVDRERPFNCAGSIRSEGLGIALFESMRGEDPSALIGLPLIRLVSMLERAGLDVLGGA